MLGVNTRVIGCISAECRTRTVSQYHDKPSHSPCCKSWQSVPSIACGHSGSHSRANVPAALSSSLPHPHPTTTTKVSLRGVKKHLYALPAPSPRSQPHLPQHPASTSHLRGRALALLRIAASWRPKCSGWGRFMQWLWCISCSLLRISHRRAGAPHL